MVDGQGELKTTRIDGGEMRYDTLVVCTGSRNRILDVSGGHLNGIHYLRIVTDVDAIRS